MKLPPDSTSSKQMWRFLIVGLLVPGVLVGAMAIIGFRTERELGDSVHWVSHTIEVRGELNQLLASVLQAESSQRGYLLTRRDSYLQPYRSSLESLPQEVARLRALTSDNLRQQENLRQLDPALAAKLAFMAETIALESRGDQAGALTLVQSDRGKRAMENIDALVQRMHDEETRLLKLREERLATTRRSHVAVLIALLGLNLLFAFGILALSRRVSQAQGLVTVCAWSRTVEYGGRWLSFEEYLRERFHLDTSHGISPAEAEKAFGSAAKLRSGPA